MNYKRTERSILPQVQLPSFVISAPNTFKRSKRNAEISSNEAADQTDIKLPNSNFTKKANNADRMKKVFNISMNQLSTTTLRIGSHNQHINKKTNVEIKEEDISAVDNTTNNNSNRKVSDERNELTSKEKLLLHDYKVLGGDEEEDSARWAMEEVTHKFNTKAKVMKTRSEKNGCISCQKTSPEHGKNQALDSTGYDKKMEEMAETDPFPAALNTGTTALEILQHNKSNGTVIPASIAFVIPKTTKLQFPTSGNPQEQNILNQTNETSREVTTAELETKEKSNGTSENYPKLLENKPSWNNISLNVPLMAVFNNHRNDRKKLTLKDWARTLPMESNDTAKVTMKPLQEFVIPSGKLKNQTFKASGLGIFYGTEKPTVDKSLQSQPTEMIAHVKTVATLTKNQLRPLQHALVLNNYSNTAKKKPIPNSSQTDVYRPKFLSSQQAAVPQQPEIQKPADDIEVIDDYSLNHRQGNRQQALMTETAQLSDSSVSELDKMLLPTIRTTRYSSNHLSYTPRNPVTKHRDATLKATPTIHSPSVIKQNGNVPYNSVDDEVVETIGRETLNQNVNKKIHENQNPLTSLKNWWGASPSVSSRYSKLALPTQKYSLTSSPLSLNFKRHKTALHVKKYKNNRNRRTPKMIHTSITSTKEEQESSSIALLKNRKTFEFKLSSRKNEAKDIKMFKDGNLPLRQFSNDINNKNRRNLFFDQANDTPSSRPKSVISFKMSHHKYPNYLIEVHPGIAQRPLDHLATTGKDKRLDINVLHTSLEPNVETKNNEDQNDRDISIKIGSNVNEENNPEKHQNKEGIGRNGSLKIIDSQRFDSKIKFIKNDAELVQETKKVNALSSNTSSKNHHHSSMVSDVRLLNTKQVNSTHKINQRNEAFRKLFPKKDTKVDEKSSNGQADTVAHILIHDLSGKPVFKGKVNFFVPNISSKTNSEKSPAGFQKLSRNHSLDTNVTRITSFPARVIENTSKDVFFKKENKSRFIGGISTDHSKNDKYYPKVDVLKSKNKHNITKIHSNESEITLVHPIDKVQQKEKGKNEVKNEQIDSIKTSGFGSGRNEKEKQSLSSIVNLPMIDNRPSKEIKMNDRLMVTENTKGNDFFYSGRGKGLKDERKNVHHMGAKTKTIKGIKSLSISLQKGNDSIPVIQQLDASSQQEDGQNPTFQIMASTETENSYSSVKGVNDSPSLSLTVTTEDSDNGTNNGKENISLNHFDNQGEQMKEGHAIKSIKNIHLEDGYYYRVNDRPQLQDQSHNTLPTTTNNVTENLQQNKNNSVWLNGKFLDSFQSNLNGSDIKFQLPKEQKISIMNEKQKLGIPLALAQEYNEAGNDQTLAGQDSSQNDVTLLSNELPGDKPGTQPSNVVTIADPTEHKLTNCRANPGTGEGVGLTILNCDNKEPSHDQSQVVAVGMDSSVPSTKSFFQGAPGKLFT